MKLSRTVGLAVAVSLVAGTVAALAQISGAAPAGPTDQPPSSGPGRVSVDNPPGDLRAPS